MPGFITHYIFGENTLKNMPQSLEKDCLSFHYTAYGLGLQGPDMFFYYFPSQVFFEENVGEVIHQNHSNQFFKSLIHQRNLRKTSYEQDVCDAYICGYIGHYTLDCLCHPYVFFRSKYHIDNGKGYFGRHVHLETDIDRVVLNYYYGLRPCDFNQHATVALSWRDRKIISSLIADAMKDCFPELKIRTSFARHAIHAISLETFLIVDPFGWKKKFLRKIEERHLGYSSISALVPSNTLHFYSDPCNLRKRKWFNPWDKSMKSTNSVLELMEQGEKTLQKRIHLYYEGSTKNLLKELGNNSYQNGLPLN